MATRLKYSSNPNHSFAKKTLDLTINAVNQSPNDIVITKDDSITITLPKDLVLDFDIQVTTPSDSGYYVEKGNNPGVYIVKSNPFVPGGVTIKPQAFWEIRFINLGLSDNTGADNIEVTEVLEQQTNQESIVFNIEKEVEKIIAWLDPKYVGDLQESTLHWQAPKGITAITISGYPNQADVPVPNAPQQGNVKVTMLPGNNGTNQRNYTVNGQLGQKLLQSPPQTLQKNRPVINAMSATLYNTDTSVEGIPITEIAVNQEVGLTWLTQYSSNVILTGPLTPNALVFKRDINLKISPGLDVIRAYYGFMEQFPAKAEYYLTANGMNQPVTQKVSLIFKNVELLYFKYTDATKKSVKLVTNPPNWIGANPELVDGNKWQCTFYQPGGESTIIYPNGIIDGSEPN